MFSECDEDFISGDYNVANEERIQSYTKNKNVTLKV